MSVGVAMIGRTLLPIRRATLNQNSGNEKENDFFFIFLKK